MITTGSNATTYYFDNNERVFPCRCGDVHRGKYAAYDWAHHNCSHDVFWLLHPEVCPEEIMCAQCGKVAEMTGNEWARVTKPCDA